jgi:hypothetical protein
VAAPTAFGAGLFGFEQPDRAKTIARLTALPNRANLASVKPASRAFAIAMLPDSQMIPLLIFEGAKPTGYSISAKKGCGA